MAAKKPQQKQTTTAGAFDGLNDMLGAGGLDALTANNGHDFSVLQIDQIVVKKQVREIFDSEEESLEDLAASIKVNGVIQPIVVRMMPDGELVLVAGERRYRASILAGNTTIPAMVRELTDEQADEIQFAENVQRKNLTQIEIAKRLQADVDNLGSIELVMEKHQKSRAWISKWLQLLELPEQTQRLLAENVSADLEVIGAVKQVEKRDPEAARQLVDTLKETRGKENARDTANAVKEQVKPSKKKAEQAKKDAAQAKKTDDATSNQNQQNTEAGKDNGGDGTSLNDEFSGLSNLGADTAASDADQQGTQMTGSEKAGSEDAGKDLPPPPALAPSAALDDVYNNINEFGASPKMMIEVMAKETRDDCEAWLHAFYEVGVKAKDLSRAVMTGFRNGEFGTEGHKAFALAAFLYGSDSNAKFSLLDVLGSVKG
ncbi:ParB/RepB/Spo0J family partition protein [Pseudomonas sp. DCB_CB]|uniref:ParB/RepB/Spo0J family partition protein n=1 Tax=unclassified Pseudomonas TaxID=196821 RepID=UPI002248C3A9|nr:MULTISPECIES: ParB/RepB/Spo0J family partition protein [unclassified Pseudomonas]MCX2694981.1 ParB/RepB/Spo0J family partition protein [Pseudomonas sp. DCB_BZ]MCX2860060.1 ParB/RepB/Spo0J family partition protein [Pseudomonas sp. DCB_CB]